MKRLGFIVALASLALAACTPATIAGAVLSSAASGADAVGVAPPVSYANHTTVDEKAGIAIEVAYNAWWRALELAIDVGYVKPVNAARVAAIDNKAYAATVAAQHAYLAGNSASFKAAEAEAKAAIREGLALVKGH